jgi:hypothetical protein
MDTISVPHTDEEHIGGERGPSFGLPPSSQERAAVALLCLSSRPALRLLAGAPAAVA